MKTLQNQTVFVTSTPKLNEGVRSPLFFYERGDSSK